MSSNHDDAHGQRPLSIAAQEMRLRAPPRQIRSMGDYTVKVNPPVLFAVRQEHPAAGAALSYSNPVGTIALGAMTHVGVAGVVDVQAAVAHAAGEADPQEFLRSVSRTRMR